jgi:hypothetical protein
MRDDIRRRLPQAKTPSLIDRWWWLAVLIGIAMAFINK